MARYLALLSIFFALPMLAANDTAWRTSEGGTGGTCRYITGNTKCFWQFDSAGQSPTIEVQCRNPTIWVYGTTPGAQLYTTPDGTYASAVAVEALNQRSGLWGNVVLDATDEYMTGFPYRTLIVDRTAGSGHVVAECKQ